MTSAPSGAVSTQQKFSASRPCPVCNGHPGLPQGQGVRCWGFLSADGAYAHCSREEKAGQIPQGPDAMYAHRLTGSCLCGVQHGPDVPFSNEPVAVYRYGDFEKGRFETPTGKSFSWRRIGVQGWPKGSSGLKLRDLPLLGAESVEYSDEQYPVFFVEGEKARQSLEDRGQIAVCAGGGAGQRDFGTALDVLDGKHVALWPDNDAEGEKYAVRLAEMLRSKAASVRLIRWKQAPPKGDAWDFFAMGGTDDQLQELLAGVVSEDEAAEIEPQLPATPEYDFTPATSSTFVLNYIEYREATSDAPLEYAEVLALGLLSAVAGPRLRVPVRQTARPLHTALYILLLGPSSVYRKSNSLEHAEAILETVNPDCIMTEPGSPERLVQDLALHAETGACWFKDEFAPWFRATKTKPFMGDMRGYMLRAYDSASVSRQLRTKKTKAGAVVDSDIAKEPALTVMGGSVPERLMEASSQDDILDGWWPRWIICWPQSRPPIQLVGKRDPRVDGLRNEVCNKLYLLHVRLGDFGIQAHLNDGAWDAVGKHSLRLTQAAIDDEENGAFYARAELRIFKIAALLAVMDDLEGKGNCAIHDYHIDEAAALVDRWLKDAIRFAAMVGRNEFEAGVDRAWQALKRRRGEALRRDIARVSHVKSRDMDEIERTLEDRGLIEVIADVRSKVWKAVKE